MAVIVSDDDNQLCLQRTLTAPATGHTTTPYGPALRVIALPMASENPTRFDSGQRRPVSHTHDGVTMPGGSDSHAAPITWPLVMHAASLEQQEFSHAPQHTHGH
jgi:hypothetical protein